VTIEELLETEQIERLRVLYSHGLDGQDLDALADLFCEDAGCREPAGTRAGASDLRCARSRAPDPTAAPRSAFPAAV